jgi:hypothetical protein
MQFQDSSRVVEKGACCFVWSVLARHPADSESDKMHRCYHLGIEGMTLKDKGVEQNVQNRLCPTMPSTICSVLRAIYLYTCQH